MGLRGRVRFRSEESVIEASLVSELYRWMAEHFDQPVVRRPRQENKYSREGAGLARKTQY